MKIALLLFLLVSKASHAFVSPLLKPERPSLQVRQAFFQDFLKNLEPKQAPPPKFEPVVIDPDFRIAGLFLGVGVILDTLPILKFTLGPLVTLLGVLFLVQANRVRFRFDEDSFEVLLSKGDDKLDKSGENFAVGGDNKWKTDSIGA